MHSCLHVPLCAGHLDGYRIEAAQLLCARQRRAGQELARGQGSAREHPTDTTEPTINCIVCETGASHEQEWTRRGGMHFGIILQLHPHPPFTVFVGWCWDLGIIGFSQFQAASIGVGITARYAGSRPQTCNRHLATNGHRLFWLRLAMQASPLAPHCWRARPAVPPNKSQVQTVYDFMLHLGQLLDYERTLKKD